jgi:hypothetical protein
MSASSTGVHDDDQTLTSLEDGASAGSSAGAAAEGAADVLGAAGAVGASGAQARRPRMSRSTMLMAATVALSGAAIGGMRYLAGGPRSSLAAPVKIDYDVDKARAGSGDHQKVLAELATTKAAQVPPSQVQRNPFMLAGALEELEVGGDGADAGELDRARAEKLAKAEADKKQREAEERQRTIETTLNGLDLHSVMGGPTPVARISGQTVRVGDVIANIFKVVQIQGRTVTLEADGKSFTLMMSTGGSAPVGGGKAPGAPAPPAAPAPKSKPR